MVRYWERVDTFVGTFGRSVVGNVRVYALVGGVDTNYRSSFAAFGRVAFCTFR